jgi:hypothetical protein
MQRSDVRGMIFCSTRTPARYSGSTWWITDFRYLDVRRSAIRSIGRFRLATFSLRSRFRPMLKDSIVMGACAVLPLILRRPSLVEALVVEPSEVGPYRCHAQRFRKPDCALLQVWAAQVVMLYERPALTQVRSIPDSETELTGHHVTSHNAGIWKAQDQNHKDGLYSPQHCSA